MDFKLYTISKKGFFVPKYIIGNEGDLAFTVHTHAFSIRRKHSFFDNFGYERLVMKRKFSFGRLKFELTHRDIHVAYIEQAGKIFRNDFVIDSPYNYYNVKADFRMTKAVITEDGNEIATISRKAFKKKDRYGIAMIQEADEKLILALAIAMEVSRKIKKARKSA